MKCVYLVGIIGSLILALFYFMSLGKTKENLYFMAGTILLIGGYVLNAYFYHLESSHKEPSDSDTRTEHEKELEAEHVAYIKKIGSVGYGLLFSFYAIAYFLPITPHVSFYDIFGVIGNLLMVLKIQGILSKTVMSEMILVVYYVLSVAMHLLIDTSEQAMQIAGRTIMALFYAMEVQL